ncbi:Zn-finger domain associated with topoisomerase type I (plasmid) [Piscirickettsia salmonis]|nr:Zn-finger domain associated with topoisomerase type I [Piscirickettsia salmonis]QGP61878.1 Zn-finger domain associated with topoisomerase type I [Piscirickettsia salmonis]QGP66505.1 Zn-finger domain associated with topoisomerase type I [Piscirickettsia salmonis]
MTCKKTFKDNRNKPVLIIQEDGPACPECTKPMKLRHAKGEGQKTSKFWGCSGYPDCRATMEIEVRV